ncbi:MAG: nucleotidyltransferase family protein [Pseudomonadota bacterium]
MRAMILAAGRGERMRPLTDKCPKPLLKVSGKALIEYHLVALQKAGITEVVINHAWLGEKIEASLGDGARYGLSIFYSPENNALETAGGIIQALPLLVSDEEQDFLVINGDIYSNYDLRLLLKQKFSSKAHLVLVNNPLHHPQGDFFLSNGYLSTLNARQTSTQEKYTFSGISLYKAEFFAGLTQGERALAPLLKQAMLTGHVSGELYQGLWTDVGTPERLQQLENQLTASQETVSR